MISIKASNEMYLRKMSPKTGCLYSEASIEPRSWSAADQSVASNPRSPSVFFLAFAGFVAPVPPLRAVIRGTRGMLRLPSPLGCGSRGVHRAAFLGLGGSLPQPARIVIV